MQKLDKLYSRLADLFEPSVARNLAGFESKFKDADGSCAAELLKSAHLNAATLQSAVSFKRAAGQINEIVHGIGILIALPHILMPDERVEALSLGAGNTGRGFDLETNLRVAEFKFIDWKGGSEAIRQNQLFKDFYLLAEFETPKRKQLYVVGTEHPIKFFRGNRACSSVFAGHKLLWEKYHTRYGESFKTVCEYYTYRNDEVEIVDVTSIIPEFASAFATAK
jgi:hypothetical protein